MGGSTGAGLAQVHSEILSRWSDGWAASGSFDGYGICTAQRRAVSSAPEGGASCKACGRIAFNTTATRVARWLPLASSIASCASAGGLIDEIDAECVVERRVRRMVVMDIGGIDRH